MFDNDAEIQSTNNHYAATLNQRHQVSPRQRYALSAYFEIAAAGVGIVKHNMTINTFHDIICLDTLHDCTRVFRTGDMNQRTDATCQLGARLRHPAQELSSL